MLDVAMRYSELGQALLPLLNPVVITKYGLEFTSFVIENVSVPPEVEAAIDKRSSMAAVGNLNDYVKYQMAQGMTTPGGGGTAGFASEMAVGMAMAQQMMQQPGGALGSQATPPAAPSVPAPAPTGGVAPALLSPGQAAQELGVSEGDVLQTLEAGDLKGKKIGSTWRISRAALDDFINS